MSGQRFWIPLTGGIQPGSSTVREEELLFLLLELTTQQILTLRVYTITVTGY